MIKSSIVRFNLFTPKYLSMMAYINNRKPNMQQISKETQYHYSHIITVMRQFQDDGIIEPAFGVQTDTLAKEITFTKKGKALYLTLFKIKDILNDEKEAEQIIKLLGGKK